MQRYIILSIWIILWGAFYGFPTQLKINISNENPGYLIITTRGIVANSERLNDFVNSKEKRGFNVYKATEICWNGGKGDTAAENIRNWLKSNYLKLNIEYVLLIGNPDPENSPIPMKIIYPVTVNNSSSSFKIPTDYYYSDLTGNWDLDKDGYYGEQPEDFDAGGVDRNYDIIVGRIPFYKNINDLDAILSKIIKYENESECSANWRKNTLLFMNPLDTKTQSYDLGEAIKNDVIIRKGSGWSYFRIYDDNYDLTPTPEITPCSSSNFQFIWSAIPFGTVIWQTHGTETMARKAIDITTCARLSKDYPAIVFQASCLNAKPENHENLAYSLLKNKAIAAIAATREINYFPGTFAPGNGDPATMAFEFARRLILTDLPCGYALQDLKQAAVKFQWINWLAFCLYGDPSIGLSTFETNPEIVLHYDFPQSGWYMISVPGTTNDMTVTNLFPKAFTDVAFEYIRGTYSPTKTLQPGKGYWLYFDKPCQYNLKLQPLEDMAISLQSKGWHLIGALNTPVNVSTINTEPIGQIAETAFSYDYKTRQYQQSSILNPQNGYWIYSRDECQFVINSKLSILPKNSNNNIDKNGQLPLPPPPPSSTLTKHFNAETKFKYQLYPNYPNPFNSSTCITFELASRADAQLGIYNILGQKVKTLVNHELNAGVHKVYWHGFDESHNPQSTGTYLFRIRTQHFSKTRKLIYLK